MKEKYLFFYFNTGGGHISAAKAVERYFGNRYPDVEIILVDGLKESPHVVKSIVEGGYANAQSYAKRTYELLYLLNTNYLIAKLNQFLLSYFTKSYIKKFIQKEAPSKIVIFHFFLVKPILAVLKELRVDIPVVTIVTDPFTATRTWFMEKNMHYIVYSERIKSYAMSLGIAEKNIVICPPIIHEKFSLPITEEQKRAIKTDLHIPLDKKVILLLGSGDGFPKAKSTLKHISKQRLDAQILIVCGRHKRLATQAQRIKERNPHLQLQIYGFVNNVDALINIADIILTKGGPAAIFEILLCKKIPVINTYMRGQEKGNVEFVVDNALGIYEPDTKKLVHKITEVLDTDLSKYHTSREKVQLEIGTQEIAEYIKEWN